MEQFKAGKIALPSSTCGLQDSPSSDQFPAAEEKKREADKNTTTRAERKAKLGCSLPGRREPPSSQPRLWIKRGRLDTGSVPHVGQDAKKIIWLIKKKIAGVLQDGSFLKFLITKSWEASSERSKMAGWALRQAHFQDLAFFFLFKSNKEVIWKLCYLFHSWSLLQTQSCDHTHCRGHWEMMSVAWELMCPTITQERHITKKIGKEKGCWGLITNSFHVLPCWPLKYPWSLFIQFTDNFILSFKEFQIASGHCIQPGLRDP